MRRPPRLIIKDDGAGLGLSIVLALINAHSGEVRSLKSLLGDLRELLLDPVNVRNDSSGGECRRPN